MQARNSNYKQFDGAPKIVPHFGCTNNIFVDCRDIHR